MYGDSKRHKKVRKWEWEREEATCTCDWLALASFSVAVSVVRLRDPVAYIRGTRSHCTGRCRYDDHHDHHHYDHYHYRRTVTRIRCCASAEVIAGKTERERETPLPDSVHVAPLPASLTSDHLLQPLAGAVPVEEEERNENGNWEMMLQNAKERQWEWEWELSKWEKLAADCSFLPLQFPVLQTHNLTRFFRNAPRQWLTVVQRQQF